MSNGNTRHPNVHISPAVKLGLLFYWLLTFALAGLGMHLRQAALPVQITLEMASDTGDMGQIFPASRAGYTEATSLRFPLQDDGDRHTYKVTLNAAPIPSTIRFDPGTSEGTVSIYGIGFAAGDKSARIDASTLKDVSSLRQNMEFAQSSEKLLRLRATGDDPYLEIKVPKSIKRLSRKQRLKGALIMAAALLAMLMPIVIKPRLALHVIRHALAQGGPEIALPTLIVSLPLLIICGFGFSDYLPSLRGLGYGSLLFAAFLGFTILGNSVLVVLRKQADYMPPLFLSSVVGQILLVAYIELRSRLHMLFPSLPLHAFEIPLLVGAAVAWQCRKRPQQGALNNPHLSVAGNWVLWLQLSIMALICVLVADRELPRLTMLSSDPDTHAFLARQLEVIGGIPNGQAAFGYPAGSASLIYAWAKLSFLDVRNTLAALPLLCSFLAGLVIAEFHANRLSRPWQQLLVFSVALTLTAGAFLIPAFKPFSHMEGAGRQMSIACFAALCVLLLYARAPSKYSEPAFALLLLLLFFSLALLNPINVVIPGILLGTFILYDLLANRRIRLAYLAPLILPILLILDPYYSDLLFGSGNAVSKITISGKRSFDGIDQVFTAWGTALQKVLHDWWIPFCKLIVVERRPTFLPVFAALASATVVLMWPAKVDWRLVLSIVSGALVFLVVLALFQGISPDYRYYLLAPYLSFSLTQHKIILLTYMACLLTAVACSRGWDGPRLYAVLILPCVALAFAFHRNMDYQTDPRHGYCGSLGCASPSDIAVLEKMQTLWNQHLLAEEGRAKNRILIPNSLHPTATEYWIFPVAGARIAPFYDIPDLAFFYYQGDDDYTTANYVKRVCEKFDVEWLRSQNISYILLPAERDNACIPQADKLLEHGQIVIKRDNSYLIQLK